jgi:hypothetical protein
MSLDTSSNRSGLLSFQNEAPIQKLLMAATIVALLQALLILTANIIGATYGLDNFGMVQAFNLDELRFITKMKVSLDQNSLDPESFYNYGNLYDSLGFYSIRFFQSFGWTVNTQLAGFVLRFLSIVSAGLAYILLTQLGILSGLPWSIAFAASLALLTMPDFVFFSGVMHPDTLQTLFVILSFCIALLRPTFAFALFAAAAAGLAFSTKYAGAAALPFCFLPLALHTFGRERPTRQVFTRLVVQGLAMIAIFLIVFSITNPYAVADHKAFIDTVRWQMNYSATGHGLVEPTNPLLWWPVIVGQFGMAGTLYLLGGIITECGLIFLRLKKEGWRTICLSGDARSEFVMLLYVLVTTAHLAISIHEREPRFFYHIVPVVIVLSTIAFWRSAVLIAGKYAQLEWVALAFSALLLWFSWNQVSVDLVNVASYSAKPASPTIKWGTFVAAHYPSGVKILADAYTYLPPALTNVTYTNLQRAELNQSVNPDIIIMNRAATGSRIWKESGTSFADRKFVRDQRYPDEGPLEALIDQLLSPSSAWKLKHENNSFVLFEREGFGSNGEVH